eukprot:gene20944-63102_t
MGLQHGEAAGACGTCGLRRLTARGLRDPRSAACGTDRCRVDHSAAIIMLVVPRDGVHTDAAGGAVRRGGPGHP